MSGDFDVEKLVELIAFREDVYGFFQRFLRNR